VRDTTVVHEAAAYGGNRKMGVVGGFWNGYGEGTLFRKHFYGGRTANVVRFLAQEALFNWMQPVAQPFKVWGCLVAAFRSPDYAPTA